MRTENLMRIFRTRSQQGFVPQSFDFEAASRPDPPPAGIGSSIARLSSMPEVIAIPSATAIALIEPHTK
jgi:hypothetical protein